MLTIRFPTLFLLAVALYLSIGPTRLQAQSEAAAETTAQDATVTAAEENEEGTVAAANDEGTSAAEENDGESADTESPGDDAPQRDISPQQEMYEEFERYKSLLANDMMAEADAVAKRIVELSIRENGFESTDTAKALTNLAIVQHKNKDYATAQQNYQAAIGIIERVEDNLDAGLINPLRGLGAAQLASGRPDQALDSFDRARHVSHVNEGPHNLDQVGILESLAEIYIYIGEYDQAYDLQDRIYELYARRFDDKSEDILPALYSRAEWQHRLRLYGRERDTYRQIIKIIEDSQSKDSLELIRPLTGLAHAYLYVGGDFERDYGRDSTITSGEVYIKRAKRIAEEHPDATWEIQEKAYLSLADYYIYSDKSGKARRAYQDAWELLSQDESRLVNRYNQLENVVLLQDMYPPRYYGLDDQSRPLEDDEEFKQGKIVLKFTVNTRGRARDYEIIEAHPPGLEDMEKSVLQETRRLIYRPRLEDGDVVDTENLTYTHEFFYRESDLPGAEQEQAPDAPEGEADAEVASADG